MKDEKRKKVFLHCIKKNVWRVTSTDATVLADNFDSEE